MTETDTTKKPLEMPPKFMPYLDRGRIYVLFKEMMYDLVVNLPKDHLKHIKVFLSHNANSSKDLDKIVMLVSPELDLDVPKLVKEFVRNLGVFVITRRCVMDRYEKHDDRVPGCISPELMSEVTKNLTLKEPVITAGWLMFDHPCTVREARCLQQDGVLPTVTLLVMPAPDPAPPTVNARTPARTFFQQDFDGLKYAYKATMKEVYIERGENDVNKIATKCFNAVRACSAGLQGPGQGFHVVGAPGIYRVLIIGPLGSGRRTQARLLAKHFGLVYLQYTDIYNEARERNDDIGEKLRKFGPSVALKAEIVKRRLLKKDCLDHGWALNGYPENGLDFEYLDNMPTPPNRIIFLNCDIQMCRERALAVAVDWCTGKRVEPGSGPRAIPHPTHPEEEVEAELDYYFSEALAELRAAAGMTAVEVSANGTTEEVNTRILTAVISAPPFNIESGTPLKGVRAD